MCLQGDPKDVVELTDSDAEQCVVCLQGDPKDLVELTDSLVLNCVLCVCRAILRM